VTSYTVYKILEQGSRQLLLVKGFEGDSHHICVYDTHTEHTVMRLTEPTIAEFKRAIALLESQ
jgi:hypothetical protein